MRILVIDDQKDVLETIGLMLRGAGHDAILANDAKSGFAQMKRGGFDVLVTDMLMPEADGIEVIKTLRRQHPELWIVAISGGGRQLSANVTLKLSQAFGADRILYKPIRKSDLLAAIQRN